MRNLFTRLLIAFLTFVVGTATTLLVRSERHPPQVKQGQESAVAPGPVLLRAESNKCEEATPEVKWVFINASPVRAQGWYNARVVIFYENGDLIQVSDTVSRAGGDYVFTKSDVFEDEVGRWTVNDDGSFAVRFEISRRNRWLDGHAIDTWLIGDNAAYLTNQAGMPRRTIATRYLQIAFRQLVNGVREDGGFPIPVKQLFDPCRLRQGRFAVSIS